MRVSRFLAIVSCVTCFSLLYVYQQTEVFRMAYMGQKRQSSVDDLLDKNAVLRYNIQRKASLVEIGNRISGSTEFQMPDTYRLVRVRPARNSLKLAQGPALRETLFSRFFGIKRQAEARTINP
ncbi:MAG: hypothetical protein FJZ09_00240 [Candidatus Omnitrophica bacterium]|nr:hypothetical protein [Candidatus Omnitrophota bacterium]